MNNFRFKVRDKKENKFVSANILLDYSGLLLWSFGGEHTLIDDQRRYDVQFFTGQKDKNRKKIFGGHILKAHHPNERPYFTGYVIWDNDCSCFSLRTGICADIPLSEFDELEIISDIYENPNLLNPAPDS